MIENKEYKTNNDMNKNKIKITENELKQIVAESVKKVLNENDFTPTSHRYTPSWGDENRKKIQMQVSKDRQKARLKDCTTNTISDWLDVQFDEETGLTYVIDKNGQRENLCNFVLYHPVD